MARGLGGPLDTISQAVEHKIPVTLHDHLELTAGREQVLIGAESPPWPESCAAVVNRVAG